MQVSIRIQRANIKENENDDGNLCIYKATLIFITNNQL